MNSWLLMGLFLFADGSSEAIRTNRLLNAGPQAGTSSRLLLAMDCQRESAPLTRLDCYDRALSPEKGEKPDDVTAGPAWQRAMSQEKARTGHSTAFLVTEGEGSTPRVVLTTPALGMAPPRPVLMLSCIDNITRLQIALAEPQHAGDLTLTANHDRFDVQWFLRENGYVVESSRGLAGIEEIRRLMQADTLTIEGTRGSFPHLTFNISLLSQALKPLRNACHW